MKRTIYNISALLFLILATTGCREKDLNESGLLRLSIGIKDKVETVTRTLSDEEQNALKGNAKIRIYSGKGLVRKYNGTAEMPAEMQLAAGDYNIKVAAGDSVAASFDKTFYRGEKDFSIHAGQSSSVSVELSFSARRNGSIISSPARERPAAIGWPPNFVISSLHLQSSSYIEYASIERPEPLTPSSLLVSMKDGLWKCSRRRPAMIPARLSWQSGR